MMSIKEALSLKVGLEIHPQERSEGMAARVDVSSGEVGQAGDAGIKPELGPKPCLIPKPFSLQRNTTFRSILAPKTPEHSKPEPCQPISAPVSDSSSVVKLDAESTTIPELTNALEVPSAITPQTESTHTTEQNQIALSTSLTTPKSEPPASTTSDPTGTSEANQVSLSELDEHGPSDTGHSATGTEPVPSPSVTSTPLQPQSENTVSEPTPAVVRRHAGKDQAAHLGGGRKRLSMELTSRFESAGLSLPSHPPANQEREQVTMRETAVSKVSVLRAKEEEKVTDSPGSPSEPECRLKHSTPLNEERDGEGVKEEGEKKGSSIQRRISLLLDSSSRPEALTNREEVPRPMKQAVSSGGVKQRIKDWAADTPPVRASNQRVDVAPQPFPVRVHPVLSVTGGSLATSKSVQLAPREDKASTLLHTGHSGIEDEEEDDEDEDEEEEEGEKEENMVPLYKTVGIRLGQEDEGEKQELVVDQIGKEMEAKVKEEEKLAEVDKLKQLELEERQAEDEKERERQKVVEREREGQREEERERERQRQEEERKREEEEERKRQREMEREMKRQRQREDERDRERQRDKEERERKRKEEKERERQIELERERERQREEEERKREEEEERERQIELERERERQREEEKRKRKEEEEKERQIELERERERQREEEERKREEEAERKRQIELERERERQREEEERKREEEGERKRQREMEREMKRQREEERERERQREEEERKREEEERERQIELERERERQREEEERKREEEEERKRQREMEREMKRQRQREEERDRERQRDEAERERNRKEEKERERQIELEKEREQQREEEGRERKRKEEKERERQIELEKKRERQREEEERKIKRKEEERERLIEFEKERERQREEDERERKRKEEKDRERQIELEKERERQREEEERKRKEEKGERQREVEGEKERQVEEGERGKLRMKEERLREKEREKLKEKEREMEIQREEERMQEDEIKREEDREKEEAESPIQFITLKPDQPPKPEPPSPSTTVPIIEPIPKEEKQPHIEVVYDDFSVKEEKPLIKMVYDDFSVKPRRWGSQARFLADRAQVESPCPGTEEPESLGSSESDPQRTVVDTQEPAQESPVSVEPHPAERDLEGGVLTPKDGTENKEEGTSMDTEEVQLTCYVGAEEGRDTEALIGGEPDKQYGGCDTRLSEDDCRQKTEDQISPVITPDEPKSTSPLEETEDQISPVITPDEPDSTSPLEETEDQISPGITPDEPDSTSPLEETEDQISPVITPDEPDSTSPLEETEDPLPFPEISAPLLDTSLLRARAELRKSRRTRPTRAFRQSSTTIMLEEDPVHDWRFYDSSDKLDSLIRGDCESDEEQPRGREVCSQHSQPQRIALFSGMDPSALKAQLKKRGGGGGGGGGAGGGEGVDTDHQMDRLAPSPSQLSRSPKRSSFLPGGSRVLPPVGNKGAGVDKFPSWLRELKSKKRSSQYNSEA
ncbi:trichohyalin-like isoform X2 [Salvelinus fontinalis]|uniref:trichohyalin-like isoform X2 n=1 Tax=Salvelinus fontinalis TaxID=8038 RepID=UPI00248580EC|nr:trichohyalin-like isoform X2 [Salvelinus fontinalis]